MPEFIQEKVNVRDLLEGMFVARLDRPWVGTPFPIQGFHIRNQNEIRLLDAYCRYVFIDVVKSRVQVPKGGREPAPRNASPGILNPRRIEYPEAKRPVAREIPVSRRLHDDLTHALEQVTARIADGRPASVAPARKLARRMIDSVLRNPDAAMWVARMRDQDHHTYARCVRSSIWAIAFGRHLGLARDRLEHLALGVLLSEVGFTRLPAGLLDDPEPGPDDIALMRTHVEQGLDILRGLGVHDEVATVLATHHERHDGSGYPGRLKRDRIPLSGQIAGLVDVYDTLTSPRPHAEALTPATAMGELNRMRDAAFGATLVDEFVQAIGIYPAGTLVELSTGEVGIVLGQRIERRLRPRVRLILDGTKAPVGKRLEIDLLTQVQDPFGKPLEIVRDLPAGSHGIAAEPPPRRGMFGRLRDLARNWRS